MGFFGFGKKKEILDLTGYQKKQEDSEKESSEASSGSASQNAFDFLGGLTGSKNENSGSVNIPESSDERKKKLAKRLADMTSKMEEMSNQIYHLEQRVELLERKTGS